MKLFQAFLAKYDAQISRLQNRAILLNWNYETNITDENSKAYQAARLKVNKYKAFWNNPRIVSQEVDAWEGCLRSGGGQRVLQHEDNGVAAQEHLGDKPVLVHRLTFLLTCNIQSVFSAQ